MKMYVWDGEIIWTWTGCVLTAMRYSCVVITLYPFVLDSHNLFTHILQGYFTGTGAIIWLPQCQWSNPEGYGLIQPSPNHNKTKQSRNSVHNLWDVLQLFIYLYKTSALTKYVCWWKICISSYVYNIIPRYINNSLRSTVTDVMWCHPV